MKPISLSTVIIAVNVFHRLLGRIETMFTIDKEFSYVIRGQRCVCIIHGSCWEGDNLQCNDRGKDCILSPAQIIWRYERRLPIGIQYVE